ncbi:MAG: AAA family ATPase [Limnochordia bacterium]|jgi:stage V sporulation protein K|nr:AAA family ATPase [Bacillota bacterium]HOB07939.1 AAA family ATPase [Limnochordia bacterium]NLH31545.1 AAA family ATPase [Bacillota bacterium]HPT93766.1 AAA family ATPase [Limnochordia bacterium]HPZ29908.1 AAA family ATPase [Limnochordia bacterium]
MSREIITMVENGEVTVSEALSLLRKVGMGSDQPKQEPARNERIAAIKQQLDSLIGLHSVKELINEIQAFVEIQQRRAAFNLAADPIVLHSIFMGNPGTGKTTVARIIGQLFLEMGVLQKGHLVEVERADLVAEYIGQTAQRTREQLRRASGGILFIDEAYSLARGGEKDFGKEAIDTIVKTMEDQRSNLVVILAGYSAPMEDFLETNPGLRSRFPIIIRFPDYTTFELFRIAEQMLQQREYQLSKAARRKLLAMIEELKRTDSVNFGNARTIRNIIEKAIRKQAVRLVNLNSPTRAQLMEIAAEDLQEVRDD